MKKKFLVVAGCVIGTGGIVYFKRCKKNPQTRRDYEKILRRKSRFSSFTKKVQRIWAKVRYHVPVFDLILD